MKSRYQNLVSSGLIMENVNHGKLAFTIASKNYLPRAFVLAKSFKSHNPDWDFKILLCDMIEGTDEYEYANHLSEVEVIPIMALHNHAYVDIEEMGFKYNIVEMNTAIKPFFLEYAFKSGFNKVVYFDPDILIVERIEEIDRSLDKYSIVITPHLLTPIANDGKAPSEVDIMSTGAYNLGFLALRKDDESLRFVKWWQKRLRRYCFYKWREGLFVDQKWIDLVPSLFDDVHILKSAGHNMAYWNLHERSLSREDDKWLVNGKPLIFYHFSGFVLERPDIISKHQDRFSFENRADLFSLFSQYRKMILDEGILAFKDKKYWFDYLPVMDTKIPESMRTRYKNILSSVDNPYNPCQALKIPGLPGDIPKGTSSAKFGINIIAPFNDISGAAETARVIFKTLLSMGIPMCLSPVGPDVPEKVNEKSQATKLQKRYFSPVTPYSINLFIGEASGVCKMPGTFGTGQKGAHRNIGLILGESGGHYYGRGAQTCMDEIWYISGDSSTISSEHTDKPRIKITYPLMPTWDYRLSRSSIRRELRLDENDYIFFNNFDFDRYEEDNPVAAVGAFSEAFPGKNENVKLVITSLGADRHPDEALKFGQLVKKDDRIVWLNGALAREKFISIMDSCDSYLSLHRYRSFGIGIAEAMYLGKCVIATARDGGPGFPGDDNSLKVDYGRSASGSTPAEPKIDRAIDAMKALYEDRSLGVEIGNLAANDVRAIFNPARTAIGIGQRIFLP